MIKTKNTSRRSKAQLETANDNGEIKVPKFQREFVWKDDQAIDLLDSLANSYPVGSLLLWKTKDKLRAERNIGEFALPGPIEPEQGWDILPAPSSLKRKHTASPDSRT